MYIYNIHIYMNTYEGWERKGYKTAVAFCTHLRLRASLKVPCVPK